MKRFIFLIVAACVAEYSAHPATDSYNYPGGVVQFNLAKDSETLPDVKFGLKNPIVMEYPNRWRILIGLSLDTLPGEYVAYIKPSIDGASGQYEKVVVEQHIYPFSEYSELDSLLSQQAVFKTHTSFSDLDFSNTRQPSLPLIWPLEGNWSNNFGHKLYDPERSKLHTPNAIVIRAEKLSTVVAPQTAIVSKIEISESGLSTVFLDHGRGLYSILAGLSDLTVELGNGIVAGAVIGKLTGPDNVSTNESSLIASTLVWQTVMNRTYVDPQILINLEP